MTSTRDTSAAGTAPTDAHAVPGRTGTTSDARPLRTPAGRGAAGWRAVVELRRYRLHAGMRDRLIDLFDTHLVEPQEEHGMRILGQFRDLDDEHRFVWLRDFPDMAARHAALSGFYGGPVWRRHRDAANATMVDSDDVLLLRPLPGYADTARAADPATRADAGARVGGGARGGEGRAAAMAGSVPGLVTVTLYSFESTIGPVVEDCFRERVDPVLSGLGAPAVAVLRTEYATNTYPALPVREGVHVVARVARFAGDDEWLAHRGRLDGSAEWRRALRVLRHRGLAGEPTSLRLAPTTRSRLR